MGFEPPAVPALGRMNTGCSSSRKLLLSDNLFSSTYNACFTLNCWVDNLMLALKDQWDMTSPFGGVVVSHNEKQEEVQHCNGDSCDENSNFQKVEESHRLSLLFSFLYDDEGTRCPKQRKITC